MSAVRDLTEFDYPISPEEMSLEDLERDIELTEGRLRVLEYTRECKIAAKNVEHIDAGLNTLFPEWRESGTPQTFSTTINIDGGTVVIPPENMETFPDQGHFVDRSEFPEVTEWFINPREYTPAIVKVRRRVRGTPGPRDQVEVILQNWVGVPEGITDIPALQSINRHLEYVTQEVGNILEIQTREQESLNNVHAYNLCLSARQNERAEAATALLGKTTNYFIQKVKREREDGGGSLQIPLTAGDLGRLATGFRYMNLHESTAKVSLAENGKMLRIAITSAPQETTVELADKSRLRREELERLGARQRGRHLDLSLKRVMYLIVPLSEDQKPQDLHVKLVDKTATDVNIDTLPKGSRGQNFPTAILGGDSRLKTAVVELLNQLATVHSAQHLEQIATIE